MSAETALRAALVADGGVAALVADRVRAERAEEDDALPYVVFSRTASEPLQTLDGSVLATRVSIDVLCVANTRAGADALADVVTAAVRAVPTQAVVGRGNSYEPELDVELTTLNVEWWE